MNLNRGKIQYYLKKYNLVKPKGFGYKKVNSDFFENIDNEIKSYLLGFFIGDGCISKDDRMQVLIVKKDLEILKLFKDHVCPGYDVKFNQPKDRQEVGKIRWKNLDMIKSLNKLGVKKNKTNDIEFTFPKINDELFIHLIRGLVDADGCWSFVDRSSIGKGYRRSFHLVHTSLKACKQIQKFLKLKGIDTIISIQNHKNMTTYSNDCYRIAELQKLQKLLYNNSNYYLKRKFEKSKLCMATPRELKALKGF